MIALLLALQEASANAPPPAVLEIHFNLAHLPPPSPGPNDIVITGRRRSNRLEPLPDVPDEVYIPRAEFSPFGRTRLSADFTPTLFSNGTVSNRMMATLKLPF